MKIIAAKIPREGMDVEFSKGAQWLAGELKSKDELKGYITGKLSCTLRLEALKDDVFVKGKASVKLKPLCSRCGREFEREFSVIMDITCIPDKRQKGHRGQDYMDGDTGLNYYTGGELDLAKIAREQVFLNLPITFTCDSDCKGLCHGCGKNLNEEECVCQESTTN